MSLPVLPGMLAYVNPEDSLKSKKSSKKKRLMGGSKKSSTKKIDNLFELVRPETHAQFLDFAGDFTSREISHLRSEDKKSLLHAAVLSGNLVLQNFLINKVEIDINSQDVYGKAAIHIAAEMGSIESMSLLLHQPVLDCSVRDINGNTFLHCLSAVTNSTMNEYVCLLRLALDKGASFFCNNVHYETPLHIAARHGQSWALAFAQQRFVNPNLVTKNWDTALHYAARSGNLDGIQTLLKQGADPFTINRQSEFPGDLLRKTRPAESNELFPPSSLVASLRGDEKSLLAQIPSMTEVVEDNDRMTLLHYAVVMGRLRVVRAILDNKDINTKSVNARNINGNTPIHFFCRLVPTKEHFTLYFELLQQMSTFSTDLFSLNYRSETPLHMAILTKNIISAKYLIQKGCPVNAPNLFGETPLHYATMCSSVKIVKLLITFGAIRARYAARPNVQPERPIDIAIKTFQHSIIFLLHIASNNSGPMNAHRAVPPTRPSSSTFASLDTWSEMYTSTSSSSSMTSSTVSHPLPNRELEEKFIILECIGQGAYSVVHRALHLETSKEFAVKTFRSVKNLQAIGNEVGILKSCNHPQIVRYHSFYQDESKVSVVMDFCQLGSLYNIRKMVTFTEPTMMYVAKSVLEGLAYLHSMGLAHRDLKGHNILLDEKGVVKIADFGVAKRYAIDEDANTLSATGSDNSVIGTKSIETGSNVMTEGITAGTPLYMAPEVIQKKSSGRRADIWSFGVTMIALADGAVPFSEHSKLSYVFSQIVEGEPPRLCARWSELFCEFVERCCQKNPEARLSAKELLGHKFLHMEEDVARKDIEDVIQTFLGFSQTGSMSVSELQEFMHDFRSRLGKIEGAFEDSPSENSQNSSILSQINRLAQRSSQDVTTGTLATLSTQPSSTQHSAVDSNLSSSTQSLMTDSESNLSNPSGYSSTSFVTSSQGSSSLREWYSESDDEWTIWVRFGDMEVIPVEGLSPVRISIHDLKKKVKLHPELTELQEFSLPQLSLLDQKGNRLKPSALIVDALYNDAHIEVVLLDLSKFESSSKPPPPQPQLLSHPQLSSNTSSYYNPSSTLSTASYSSDGGSSNGHSQYRSRNHDQSHNYHHNYEHNRHTNHGYEHHRTHEHHRNRSRSSHRQNERREM